MMKDHMLICKSIWEGNEAAVQSSPRPPAATNTYVLANMCQVLC